jgi:hypothetical protein
MSTEIDILSSLDSLDLTNVSTGFSIIPAGLYEVSVAEMKIEPNKKGTGHNCNAKLALTQPTTAIDGKTVNPGFPIFHTISLVETDKYKPASSLAAFKECFTGTKAGTFMPVSQFIGNTGSVRVTVETSDQYGQQNRIARFVKKG